MRVLILGSTGMLGNAVGKYFLSTSHDVTLTHRNSNVSYHKRSVYYDPLVSSFTDIGIHDYVINCIGTIKPFMASDPIAARKINSVFPWELADWCNKKNMKLIHITTDCVFSGRKGSYKESDLHDALDDYGKSKSLGEPVDRAMVIRTSIIGEEIHKKASLIEWAKSQKGKEVKGFTNHYWNGITTKEYAKVCHKIIENDYWHKGLTHIHSENIVSKFDMLEYFNQRFELELNIVPTKAGETCDRSLSSEKDLCATLRIGTVKSQVNEL